MPATLRARPSASHHTHSGCEQPRETQHLALTFRSISASWKLSDGLISPEEAIHLLNEKLNHLANHHQNIILEGGSISLLNAIAQNLKLPPPHAIYMRKAEARVRGMLSPSGSDGGIVQELQNLWPDLQCRSVLKDIDGSEHVKVVVASIKQPEAAYSMRSPRHWRCRRAQG
ncbi:isopentenyl transferase family protein [Paracidovorax citrulli]|uniref:isopentenyl transferase family protein n=4 Tax=Paracidovorax citrulli TaxID=80869 RepID=UPI0014030AA8